METKNPYAPPVETPPPPDLPEVADEHLAGERLFAAVTSLARWARIAAILLLILGTLSILSTVGDTARLSDSSTSFEVVLIVVGLPVAALARGSSAPALSVGSAAWAGIPRAARPPGPWPPAAELRGP